MGKPGDTFTDHRGKDYELYDDGGTTKPRRVRGGGDGGGCMGMVLALVSLAATMVTLALVILR